MVYAYGHHHVRILDGSKRRLQNHHHRYHHDRSKRKYGLDSLLGTLRQPKRLDEQLHFPTTGSAICKSFDKKAFLDLSMRVRDQSEEVQNFMGLSRDLFSKYKGEITESQPWPCVACKKPATAFHSQHACFLFPEAGAKTERFVPMILGVYIPVCPSDENGGVCSNTGFVMGTHYRAAIEVNNPWRKWDQMKTRQNCRSTSNIQLRGGCKLLGQVLLFSALEWNKANKSQSYCSKECQTQSWASHKEICKLAKNNKDIRWDT
jgi:MYND finger